MSDILIRNLANRFRSYIAVVMQVVFLPGFYVPEDVRELAPASSF